MALTHSTAARNASATAVLALLNVGSANTAGIARFRNASNVVTAALPLSNPAFATPSGGSSNANAVTADTNAAGGVTTQLTLEDRDRNVVLTANDLRTTTGGDLQGNSLTFGVGDTVQLLSLQYVAPQ